MKWKTLFIGTFLFTFVKGEFKLGPFEATRTWKNNNEIDENLLNSNKSYSRKHDGNEDLGLSSLSKNSKHLRGTLSIVEIHFLYKIFAYIFR